MSDDIMKTLKITLKDVDTGDITVKKVMGYPLAMYVAAALVNDVWQLIDRKTGAKIKDGFNSLGEARLHFHHEIKPKWNDFVRSNDYIEMYQIIKKEVGDLV